MTLLIYVKHPKWQLNWKGESIKVLDNSIKNRIIFFEKVNIY